MGEGPHPPSAACMESTFVRIFDMDMDIGLRQIVDEDISWIVALEPMPIYSFDKIWTFLRLRFVQC